MLYLENTLVDVTEFNEEKKDWSGDRFSKGALENKETLQDTSEVEIKRAIARFTYPDLEVEDMYIAVLDGSIIYNQIEDEDGVYDEDGKYLVDYSFKVIEVKEVEISLDN